MKQFLLGLLAAVAFTPAFAQTITPPQTPVGIYSTTGALKGNGAGTVSQAACSDLSNGATGCSTTVGTAATANIGTSGGTVPLLNGANTYSAANTFNDDLAVHGMVVGLGPGAVSSNITIGQYAAGSNTTGADNIAIGFQASFTNSTGNYNTALGVNALYYSTNGSNVGIGYFAGENISTGTANVGVGYQSLLANQTGSNNIAIGSNALLASLANDNTAIGYEALYQEASTGTNNTAIGYVAGGSITTGSYNTLIGPCAGTAALSTTVEICDGQTNVDITATSTGINSTPIGATTASTGAFTTGNFTTSLFLNGNLALSPTAPTIANGGGLGTVGTITGSAAAFDVTAGTGAASVFVITLPTAAHGWVCNGNDVTTHSTTVSSIQQTVGTNNTTTVTMGAYTDVSTLAAVGTADHIRISCMAY